ncbi:ABC transporter ATP-binding protein [Comamonas sp. NLF-1-9]|uniref:ABC transporter ATP-binding protein n=1 Tax=Comamonas sp. NLF-1-9 TaxID=2853163 RepID=UPI001C43D7C9|nr:ATP-binding cassette domain-containing protein [Comamonas sp. NLF-1-9]QXL84283.1 ATP-binding cassette domain-containing protein [Comamonas sp. NLF-1-9]
MSAAATTGATPAALTVQALSHAFGPREVLQDITLQLPAGHTLALVGPSGSGKSTLLHLCAGLLTVRAGQVDNGFARTAMLFQQPHLLPWKTVLDNIALGLKARGLGRAQRLAQARAMGEAMGLDALALAQFPGQLSGGMQSRAALARALVLQPDLLLLDEPFSALDIGLREQMHQLLLAEQARRQLAVLMITHDLTEAVALADSVLVLAGAPARICWRLDLSLPAPLRDDDWVHRQTALLLAQPVVRAAFELPPAKVESPRQPAVDASGIQPGQAVQQVAAPDARRCEVPL